MSDERDLFEVDVEGEDEHLDPEVTEKLLEAPFVLGEHLREQTARELDRREGQWTAFSAGVFREIDDAHRATMRMSAEDRAIASFKEEVAAELLALEPKFEKSFKDGVERRIWRSAKVGPTRFERMAAWVRAHVVSSPWAGFGLATATAALIALFFFSGMFNSSTEIGFSNDVSIDQVTFEGTVTVMPAENGMTVMWLASDESS